MSEQWSDLIRGKKYILDLGEKSSISARYAVWIPDAKQGGRHQIAMVGNSLEKLMEKFKVSQDYVFKIMEVQNE